MTALVRALRFAGWLAGWVALVAVAAPAAGGGEETVGVGTRTVAAAGAGTVDAAGDRAAAGEGTAAGTEPGARSEAPDGTVPAADGDGDGDGDEDGPLRTPRGEYNAGLALLGAGDHEAAARAFLRARDRAGPDPELRYRAAFNLGLALAAGAGDGAAGSNGAGSDGSRADSPAMDAADGASPADAIERAIAALRRSAAWFADAVRLAPPGNDDARINLELVSRRILTLADRLRGADRLQARLERLIDDQRGVRDRLRSLFAEVEADAASAEPHGFRDAYDDLASRERMLAAEVGNAVDTAAEERLFVEQTPEAERTAEQRLRVWQLAAVAAELERARQSLGESRRSLRRMEGERAHRRVEAALADLKRARERLLDPLAVLGAVARDQAGILAHTAALAAAAVDGTAGAGGEPPGWLTSEHLAERQGDAAERAGEVLARFEAAAPQSAPGQESKVPEGAETTGGNPRAERTVRAAGEAAPVLGRAVGAMRTVVEELGNGRPDGARDAARTALEELRQAIEAFAGVRQLVELAHRDQESVMALLEDGGDGGGEAPFGGDRAEAILALAAGNARRLEKLKGRLEEERADEVAAAGGDSARAGPEPAEAQERRRSIEERYRRAEVLRGRARAGLRDLDAALAGVGAGPGAGIGAGAGAGAESGPDAGAGADPETRADAHRAAEDTLAALDELRRLFFSIAEHLEALRSDQADTRDRTAALQSGEDTEVDRLAADLGFATERQEEHQRLAAALAGALAEQADAAGGEAPGGAPTAAPAPDPAARDRLAEAAVEVRTAGERMLAAGARLAEASPGAASPDLDPVLEEQMAAIEHLENALRAIASTDRAGEPQPAGEPQSAEAGSGEERSGEEEALSRREALRRLQAIRDREAERRRGREAPGHEPVEKDW